MDLQDFIISENMSTYEAMSAIDKNGHGIVYICGEDSRLLAALTDGNIRRFILSRGELSSNVSVCANYSPVSISSEKSAYAQDIMRERHIRSVPIVDDAGHILSIEFLNEGRVFKDTSLNTPVVFMAGGKGTRLYPYTEVLPKPLIPVGSKTITEHILDRFAAFGCTRISMIVNYKKSLIKAYFSEVEDKRDITFYDEQEFLGTGGGLRMLSGKINETFFMTNCDVLIDDDYSEILKAHKANGNIITIVCAAKDVTIPYGTIELAEDGSAASLHEKPSFFFITSTGFYVIEPEFLDKIPENKFIHITDVIEQCIKEGLRVGVYPISERSWLDMGTPEELEKMRIRLSE